MSFSHKFQQGRISQLASYGLFLFILSVVVGLFIALYVYLIQLVTECRFHDHRLVFVLPFFGLLTVFVGNSLKSHLVTMNTILDAIHQSGKKVPLLGGVYVYIATVLTHLFGASVGAEGTAVQFAGSVASYIQGIRLFGKHLFYRLDDKLLIMMGVAAGFGAVFNVPLAGAFFACEFIGYRVFNYRALLPCLFASFGAVQFRNWAGVVHPVYSVLSYADRIDDFHITKENWSFWLYTLVAAIIFGLLAKIYSEGLYYGTKYFKQFCSSAYLRIFIGGVVTIVLAYLIGTDAYLGLGALAQYPHEPTIMNFYSSFFYPDSWMWKLIFALIALCSGYKGGEVTVLFFIGAAGGNTLGHYLNMPVDLLASAGMVSVFAASANTPLTGFVLALELFGFMNGSYYFIVTYIAYLVSNPLSGIYLGQRLLKAVEDEEEKLVSLKELKAKDH